MIYTLDTNVLVDALRQSAELDRLKAFLTWALPSTVLSSVVAAELTAGARTDKARRTLDELFLDAFDRRGRIIAPSASAWRRTGAVLGKIGPAGLSASRQNDALLAVQAREGGWTLVTRDRDFEGLRPLVAGLKFTEPYPERP
jgi:predicted nucleic acid-binding protein